MAQKKEKTIVSQFTAIEEILRNEGHTELADFMVERIEKQMKKNVSKSGGVSKTAEANKALAEALYEAMDEGVSYTATQLYGLGVEGITSGSKATAVVKVLTEDGRVTISKGKSGNLYTA